MLQEQVDDRKVLVLFLIYLILCSIWASSPESLSSGFPTKRVSNQSLQLQRLARKQKISLLASLDMILLDKRITKALINLRGCAGWSVPVLFANPRRQVFSREAHIYIDLFIKIA